MEYRLPDPNPNDIFISPSVVELSNDLGFSNDGYILPKLHTNKHVVKNNSTIDIDGQIQMFNIVAKNFNESVCLELKGKQKSKVLKFQKR